MIYILITIFAVLFAFLSWRHIYWGLYLVIVCLPAYGLRFDFGPVPMTLLELMILVLFAVWMAKAWNDGNLRPQSRFWESAIVILLISTVAMFISSDLREAAGIWKAYFLEGFLFFTVFSGLVKDKEAVKRVILVLGVPALYISTFAVVQYMNDGWMVPYQYWFLGEGPRVTSFYSYPNAIGLFVAPIIALFLGYWYARFKNRNWPRVIYSSAVIITGFFAIYLASSEGAMVALAAVLILMGLAEKRFRLLTIILVAVILIGLLSTSFGPALWHKITLQDWSGQVRLSMWQETWHMLKDNWFLGSGLSGYQTALVPYHQAKHLEIFLYPHNIIFNFWVELGLVGLLAFIYLLIKFFYLGCLTRTLERESKRILSLAIMGGMIVMIVHGLVDVPFFKNDLAILWWIFIGMMSALSDSS